MGPLHEFFTDPGEEAAGHAAVGNIVDMAFVYIVRCSDNSYYVGSTEKDPDSRVWEHNNDEQLAARYTIKRRPVVLVYVEEYDSTEVAFRREKQLQGWSRAKKEALMEGRIDDLMALSRRRT